MWLAAVVVGQLERRASGPLLVTCGNTCVCVSKDQGGEAILLVCTCTCMPAVRCHNFSAYNIRYSEYLLLQRNKLD